jgi:CspA family cold shock protein
MPCYSQQTLRNTAFINKLKVLFMSNRETGKVKWFNPNKGFGFIARQTGEDVFVHFRGIRGEGYRLLKDGQAVEFSVTDGQKGLQAEDVVAIDEG